MGPYGARLFPWTVRLPTAPAGQKQECMRGPVKGHCWQTPGCGCIPPRWIDARLPRLTVRHRSFVFGSTGPDVLRPSTPLHRIIRLSLGVPGNRFLSRHEVDLLSDIE